MKILEINVTCGNGSTGRICTDIASLAKKKGHECKVAYGRKEVLEQHKEFAVRIGGKYGTYADALTSRVFDNAGFNSKTATKKFIKWVEEYDPDIIHLHNLHGYYINVKVLFDYIKKAGKPVIWTLHDCWSFTGHCAHFDLAGCMQWEDGGCRKCIQKKEYPSSSVLSRSKMNYIKKKNAFLGVKNLHIVTPSKWLGKLVQRSYLKDYPVHIINNGINLSVFKPTESNFKSKCGIENKILVLAVASVWTEKKGFSDFVELSKQLDDRYACVMVGVNEAQKAGLPSSVIAIERTNSVQELAEIYSSADVFVNMTYEDTYPTVNLEAVACGTPVITYPTGGSIEIAESFGGFVSKKRDVGEIAEIITSKFGEMKKDKAVDVDYLKMLDEKERYSEYLELFETILNK